jgi:hypothetical protein
MGEILTREEIERRFVSEFVLVEDPETTPMLEVIRGRVLWHCKDRDELYEKMLELRPRSSAVVFTGKLPDDVVYIL